MGEPKAFASLSSGLLARKGQAKPAMRPQGFGGFGMSAQTLEDLGWNDMGHDRPAPPSEPRVAEVVPFAPVEARAVEAEVGAPAIEPTTPSAPPPAPAVVQQQQDLAREIEAALPAARAAAGSKGRAAFTLRLDPERHLKLRLASAVAHKSAQAIVVAALDQYLNAQGDGR